ncbi:MAG: AAA family ATPase [Planctomycetaceae bacterium]
MSAPAIQRFDAIWRRALVESPLVPEGAIDQLMDLLAELLDVEQIQQVSHSRISSHLYDMTPLALSGMGWNVMTVAAPPQDELEARMQADFLHEQRQATDSIGLCFQIMLAPHRPEPNPFVSSVLQSVVLSRDELHRLCEAQIPRGVFAAIVREQIPLSRLCPFNTNQEASGAMFYGRRQELDLLVEDLSQSFAIEGARRVGKTSLVKQAFRVLKTRDARDSRRVYYFNCLNWHTYQHAIQMMVHSIDPKRELRLERSAWNIEYVLERRSRGGARPLLLFFDEVDRLVELDSMNDWRFFHLLATANAANHVRFVLAGYRSVGKLVLGAGDHRAPSLHERPFGIVESPLFQKLNVQRLGPLTRADADALLEEPLRQANVELQQPGQIKESLWNLAAGYPFLVQFLGQLLYRQAVGQFPHILTMEDLRKVSEGNEIAQFLESHFLENTVHEGVPSVSERACALVFAHSSDGKWTALDFLEACQRHRVTLGLDPLRTIHHALRSLVDAQILTLQRTKYDFAFPAMRQLLIDCYPRLEASLRALQESSL